MKNIFKRTVLYSITLSLVLLCPSMALSATSNLVTFKMKDQFGNVHTDEQFRGNVLVFIGSDKGGSDYNRPWSKAIYATMGDDIDNGRIRIIGFADLRGIPFFLKIWVKGKFPKDRKEWALMDWKGRLAEAYDLKSDMSNIVIFDSDGTLVHKTFGQAVEEEKLRVILEKLKSIVGKNE